MQGQRAQKLSLRPRGVLGDRAYGFRDVATGRVVSAKHDAALLECRARFLASPLPAAAAPPLEVTFPDGTVVGGEDDEVARRTSALVRREVRLTAAGGLVDLAPVHVVATSTLDELAAAHPA